LALGGVAGLMMPVARDFPSMILIMLLNGISFGLVSVFGSALVARDSTSKNRGVAYGLYSTAQAAGNMVLVATSPIADSLGFAPVFVLGGIASLTATTPLFLDRPSSRNTMTLILVESRKRIIATVKAHSPTSRLPSMKQ